MHPFEEIKFEYSRKLEGKKISLCITGSVAAVESFYICRDLIRHGADVDIFMTPSSTRFIHPDLMEFASGKKPILDLSGKAEHLNCGRYGSDLVLIAPSTANTISKIAMGIADNSVTSCALTSLGAGKPVIIVPAMHLDLMNNKFLKENIERLKRAGCRIIETEMEGGRAKLSDREIIVENVIRELRKNDLSGKSILIIGGASAERIDDIRVLTNRSSGRLAVELSKEIFERGAYVELWHGWMKVDIPKYIKTRSFESVKDLIDLVEDMGRFDFILVCAALSNYIPRSLKGKIPSSIDGLTIDLDTAPRIIDLIKKSCRGCNIIAFKAEHNQSNLMRGCKSLSRKFYMVVGNLLEAFGADETKIWICKDGDIMVKVGKKSDIARYIVDEMVRET